MDYIYSDNFDVNKLEQWQIDKYIETVKQNESELKKYKNILDKRIEDLKLSYQLKEDKIKKENELILSVLGQFAKNQKDLKTTKTQHKWEGLSGEIIIKKSLPKTKKPADDKLKDIEKNYPEFVQTEEVKKLDWRGMKGDIILQNGVPYSKKTGEDLSNIVPVEYSQESVQVK